MCSITRFGRFYLIISNNNCQNITFDNVYVATNILAAKSIFEENVYTSEVLYFTGLDGSKCYESNDGDPIKQFRTFAFAKCDGITRCNRKHSLLQK